MDFSRWNLPGIKRLSKLSARYRNFQEFLGEVLDGDRELLADRTHPSEESGKSLLFITSDDIDSLSAKPRAQKKMSAIDSLTETFTHLAPFFEGGFLYEERPRSLRASLNPEFELRSMFLFGRVFEPRASEKMKFSVELPPSGFQGVLRGKTVPLLRRLKLESIKSLHSVSVFALSPSPGFVVLLLCDRPHPWQLGMIEKSYYLLKGMDADV